MLPVPGLPGLPGLPGFRLLLAGFFVSILVLVVLNFTGWNFAISNLLIFILGGNFGATFSAFLVLLVLVFFGVAIGVGFVYVIVVVPPLDEIVWLSDPVIAPAVPALIGIANKIVPVSFWGVVVLV